MIFCGGVRSFQGLDVLVNLKNAVSNEHTMAYHTVFIPFVSPVQILSEMWPQMIDFGHFSSSGGSGGIVSDFRFL